MQRRSDVGAMFDRSLDQRERVDLLAGAILQERSAERAREAMPGGFDVLGIEPSAAHQA